MQFNRLQTQAVDWNKTHWENGTGLRVTVAVSSNDALGANTVSATLNCYQKQFALPGGLKGRPGTHTVVKVDGPDHLAIPFGPEATHVTPLRDVCSDAFRTADAWQLPQVTQSPHYWSNIAANDGSFQCFLGNDPRTMRGEVTRPTFTALERVPVRDMISSDAFDQTPYRPDDPQTRPPTTYYWWLEDVETQCWRRNVNDPCTAEIEALCGSVLP